MKKNAIIRIIVYSVIVLVLTAALAAGIFLSRMPSIPVWHTALSGADSGGGAVESAGVRELEIQWTAGSVTIQPDDIDRIEFAETGGEEHPMVWKLVKDRLVIQDQEGTPWNGWKNLSKDLVIRIPRQWQPEEVDIQTASAHVTVNELTAGSLELNGVSGVTELRGCQARELSFEGVSGETEIQGKFGSVDAVTVSGDCSLTLDGMPGELELETVSGDMTLEIPADSGFSVELDSVSGALHTDLALRKNGDVYTFGDGACRIDAQSVSGDLAIQTTQP